MKILIFIIGVIVGAFIMLGVFIMFITRARHEAEKLEDEIHKNEIPSDMIDHLHN